MSAETVILRGEAARAARPVPLAAHRSPAEVMATGPWSQHLDQARRDAHAQGVRQGRAEGREAGRAEGQAEVRARADGALRALEAAAARLGLTDAVTVAEVAPRILELALELTQLILQRELASTEEPGLDALRRVLPLAPAEGEVVVRLNPGDAAELGPYTALAPGRSVTIVADPSLASGDAVLDCGPSRIDARLDQAMARIAGALRGQEVLV